MTILPVSATDNDDSPENKRITFSIIEGDPEGVFTMENQEPNVGNIVLRSMLDRETKDRYSLTILAADGGEPAKNTTTVVRTRAKSLSLSVSEIGKRCYFNMWQNERLVL